MNIVSEKVQASHGVCADLYFQIFVSRLRGKTYNIFNTNFFPNADVGFSNSFPSPILEFVLRHNLVVKFIGLSYFITSPFDKKGIPLAS